MSHHVSPVMTRYLATLNLQYGGWKLETKRDRDGVSSHHLHIPLCSFCYSPCFLQVSLASCRFAFNLSRLKPTSNSLRSQSTQASVLQSETYASRQADTWSPRDGTIYLGADSPSHSCSHNLSSLSCSWEDSSAPKQTQAARLPGQVLASTKSRTCAASHFQAFRLNLKSREGRPRKSFGEDPHKEGQFSQCQGSKSDKLEAAPRLPGRVLEDTLSRTCAAAFLAQNLANLAVNSAASLAVSLAVSFGQSHRCPHRPRQKERKK